MLEKECHGMVYLLVFSVQQPMLNARVCARLQRILFLMTFFVRMLFLLIGSNYIMCVC